MPDRKSPEGLDLHKRVVDRDDKDLTSILELGRVDVAGNMAFRARGREGGRDTYGAVRQTRCG